MRCDAECTGVREDGVFLVVVGEREGGSRDSQAEKNCNCEWRTIWAKKMQGGL